MLLDFKRFQRLKKNPKDSQIPKLKETSINRYQNLNTKLQSFKDFQKESVWNLTYWIIPLMIVLQLRNDCCVHNLDVQMNFHFQGSLIESRYGAESWDQSQASLLNLFQKLWEYFLKVRSKWTVNADTYKSLKALLKNWFHTFPRPRECMELQGFTAPSTTEKLHSYIP